MCYSTKYIFRRFLCTNQYKILEDKFINKSPAKCVYNVHIVPTTTATTTTTHQENGHIPPGKAEWSGGGVDINLDCNLMDQRGQCKHHK